MGQVANGVPSWDKEPDSFRGVKFGSAEGDVRATLKPWLCGQSGDDGACYFHLDISSRQYNGIATFFNGRMSEVFCVFPESDFSAVRDVLVLAYGDPSRDDEDKALWWTGRSVTAELNRSLPEGRKIKVNQIAVTRAKFELDLALETHQRILNIALDLFKQTHDRRASDKMAADASKDFEKDEASAIESRDRFMARKYGSFSVSLNSYLNETARRANEQKKRDAAAIR
jgi:hypothetical protein